MRSSPLAKQLFRRIFGLYLITAIGVTAVQLGLEYRHTQTEVKQEMKQVLNTFTPGISDALWNYNTRLIGSILIGMHELAVIDGIQVFDHRGVLVQNKGVTLDEGGRVILKEVGGNDLSGQDDSLNTLKERLFHQSKENQRLDYIGEMIIYSSNKIVIDRVKYGFILIIVNSVLKTAALWLIFFYFINHFLSKPLTDFTQQIKEINLDNMGDHSIKIDAKDNELDYLQNHFNDMIKKIKDSSDQITQSNKNTEVANLELETLNNELEKRVKLRTQELEASMEELSKSTKMASLSRLLTGMAHEFNTPLGVAITSASFQIELIEQVRIEYESGTLTKVKIEAFINNIVSSNQLMFKNLDFAGKLVNRFKQLDSKNKLNDSHTFNLLEYINLSLHSFEEDFERYNITLHNNFDPDLIIKSDPTAFSKVIITLIENSIKHGFKNLDSGNISIIAQVKGSMFILTYQDDGNGIEADRIDSVFDPFTTTKMGSSGPGLGLNILYNLINFQLKGDISCSSTFGQGVKFVVRWPVVIE